MHCLRTAVFLAALLASSGGLAPEEALVYAPAEGTILTRTFHQASESQLESDSLTIGDEQVEKEDLDLELTTERSIVITDEIESMGAGQPLRLIRRFDELASAVTYSSEEFEDRTRPEVSDLEGVSVLVTWDAEDEEYDFEPAEDEEIDEALLEHLQEDMDFRLFLPEDEVDEGASWEIPVPAWISVNSPSGYLSFRYEEEEHDDNDLKMILARKEATEGEGEATFEEVRVENGRKLAVIAFRFELSSDVEVEFEPPATEEVISQTRGLEQSFEIEGELLWDLEHGHAHSFSATSEAVTTFSQRAVGPDEGTTTEMVRKQVFVGEGRTTVTLERR